MLRRRINSHESLIYHLHPELFLLAASHLVTNDLVKASHVSYRWRAMLISCPSLWSTLGFAHTNRAWTFLERSGSTPIHVLMHFSTPPDTVEFLNQHAARITTLVLNDVTLHRRLLLQPMSSLRTLDFYWNRNHSDSIRHRMEENCFPTVTKMTARGGDSFPFSVPRLTQLQVHSYHDLAMDELIVLLHHCPLLEELEIEYIRGTPIRHDHNTVKLFHLRSYNHHTSTNTHLNLFDQLSFPTSCSVVFNYWNGFTDIHGIHDSSPPFYNPSSLADIKRIRLRTGEKGGCSADATVELVDAKHTRVCLTRSVGWAPLMIPNRYAISELYLAYLEDLDARVVEVFCVGGFAPWMSVHAREVLSCLGNIRTLVLSDTAVKSYIHALAPYGSGPPCSVLDVLVIHSENLCIYGEDTLEHLSRVAQRRKEAGIPLESVSLFVRLPWDLDERGPMGSCPALEQLRECVGRLEIVMGDDVLDWNIDDYFFDGLEHVRRDRHLFREI